MHLAVPISSITAINSRRSLQARSLKSGRAAAPVASPQACVHCHGRHLSLAPSTRHWMTSRKDLKRIRLKFWLQKIPSKIPCRNAAVKHSKWGRTCRDKI